MYGAAPTTWDLFQLLYGVGEDLLPVVSRPGGKVSPHSALREYQKVPSRYNAAGEISGFAGWVQHKATDANIAQWRGNRDYGMCLQSRVVRALDGDIHCPDASRTVLDFIDDITVLHFSLLLPIRRRAGSSKWLLMYRLPGEYYKRVVKVEGGMIENLNQGQQFVVEGTHPDGSRYCLDMRGNADVPTLTAEQYTTLWDSLVAAFAVEDVKDYGGTNRRNGEDIDKEDTVLPQLNVIGWGRNGEAFITCPFAEEHTTDSGVSSTVYFPAGTGGYELGHFKCLHAHCTDRDDADFIEALGVRMATFDALPTLSTPVGTARDWSVEPLPPMERDASNRIVSNLVNLQKALSHPGLSGVELRHDAFREEIMMTEVGREAWRPLTDFDYVVMREHLERKTFRPIGRELIRDAVILVAHANEFDAASHWLAKQQWDGVPRISNFVHSYFGGEDSDYTRAVSMYMWTALAGRILSPGVKVDMVPILQGEQGAAKSSAIEALAPDGEFFAEISLGERDDDLARRTKGKLVVSIDELRGLRSRELEAIKSYITRRFDSWIPKYREQTVNYPRRMVFFGTTNEDEFLADSTGHRRWLPFTVTHADVVSIVRDRSQLWAEAAVLFTRHGVAWQEAERLANQQHERYVVKDVVWTEEVLNWLNTPVFDENGAPTGLLKKDMQVLTTKDVLHRALGIPVAKITRKEELRAAGILRNLGYHPRLVRDGERVLRAWSRERQTKNTPVQKQGPQEAVLRNTHYAVGDEIAEREAKGLMKFSRNFDPNNF